MVDPTPFTDRRFEEGSEDYYIPFLVRGVCLRPTGKVRWRIEVEGDDVRFPEEQGPIKGETLCQVLEKVIEVIRQDDFECDI